MNDGICWGEWQSNTILCNEHYIVFFWHADDKYSDCSQTYTIFPVGIFNITLFLYQYLVSKLKIIYKTMEFLNRMHTRLMVRLHIAFLVRDSWLWLENSDYLFVDLVSWPIDDWNFPFTVMSCALKRLNVNRPLVTS